MLDDSKSGMDMLPKIINNCLLIGYGNKKFDDIFLNFIYYHQAYSNKELWTLREMIDKQVTSNIELWHNNEIEFYMNKHVESIDLSEVTIIDRKPILSDDIATLINDSSIYCEELLSALNRFLEDNNYGFKRGIHRQTSESAKLNYILRKIL